jgi:hypothetical protein
MKSASLVSIFLISSFLFNTLNTIAQDINVTKLIGKDLDSAVKQLGRPVHQDRNNKEMECVFYKSKTHQIILVANKNGIYQAEGMKCYDSKNSAQKLLNSLISQALSMGCKVDTVNASEYRIDKKGCEANIMLMENPSSKKYEVKIKASRRED